MQKQDICLYIKNSREYVNNNNLPIVLTFYYFKFLSLFEISVHSSVIFFCNIKNPPCNLVNTILQGGLPFIECYDKINILFICRSFLEYINPM